MKAVLPLLLIILGAAVCFHEAFVFSNPGRDSDFAVYFAAAKVAAAPRMMSSNSRTAFILPFYPIFGILDIDSLIFSSG